MSRRERASTRQRSLGRTGFGPCYQGSRRRACPSPTLYFHEGDLLPVLTTAELEFSEPRSNSHRMHAAPTLLKLPNVMLCYIVHREGSSDE